MGVEVRIVKSVDIGKLLGVPLRRFFNEAMLVVYNDVVDHAPVDTGILRASLAPGGVTEVDPRDPPQYARVGTNVDYGTYLDDQDKTGRYHYRAGPNEGDATTGFLTGSLDRQDGAIDKLLKDASKDIESQWKAA